LRKGEHQNAELALLQELGTRMVAYGFKPKPTGREKGVTSEGGKGATVFIQT